MTPPARRPHRKSRTGCKTCKRRRVKCDENGLPCGPCALRGIDCGYADTSRLQQPTPERSPSSKGATPCSVPDAIEWTGQRRLLELELLHQWTTVTYKSYCGTMASEYHNWQVVVPRVALQHDYLLHGMLAMSALEIAAFTKDDESRVDDYVNTALEYHNLASSGLRRELSNITPANRQALFALSSILLILGLALPRFVLQRGEQGNMLDYMMTYLALLKGLRTIADTEADYRKKEPLVANFKVWNALPAQVLEPELLELFQRLSILNEEMHGASQVDLDTPELQAMSYHAACRRAMFYLEEDFAKCRDVSTRSYSLGWPLRAGHEYAVALNDKEPVALLTMMVWGVLLEQTSHGVWWAEGIGSRVVEDLSKLVDTQGNAKLMACVQWARVEVGLPFRRHAWLDHSMH
ncbi:uncharacterized protein LTR77_005705 [Saxophila tyrrhenica]|uniref:Zn(2)-C6 fungal-type domain-containing protein n=1 Tax=Saxophila tyrrhenica TaxID=1690608 RepID=A0AAV9PDB2_9PEZI|nr:hypothetical protein LTR77_005705 [Saxophila tyrrhenica]